MNESPRSRLIEPKAVANDLLQKMETADLPIECTYCKPRGLLDLSEIRMLKLGSTWRWQVTRTVSMPEVSGIAYAMPNLRVESPMMEGTI